MEVLLNLQAQKRLVNFVDLSAKRLVNFVDLSAMRLVDFVDLATPQQSKLALT